MTKEICKIVKIDDGRTDVITLSSTNQYELYKAAVDAVDNGYLKHEKGDA